MTLHAGAGPDSACGAGARAQTRAWGWAHALRWPCALDWAHRPDPAHRLTLHHSSCLNGWTPETDGNQGMVFVTGPHLVQGFF